MPTGHSSMNLNPTIEALVVNLDNAFHGRGWQGTTLLGSLRGVTAAQAVWRPSNGRRCIWEHALHTAYWKYIVRRTLSPRVGDAFPRSPSNWPRVPQTPDEQAWRADISLLKTMHEDLRTVLVRFDPRRLGRVAGGRKFNALTYIVGAAAHDSYHTGQVQLIKRLMNNHL